MNCVITSTLINKRVSNLIVQRQSVDCAREISCHQGNHILYPTYLLIQSISLVISIIIFFSRAGARDRLQYITGI